MFIALSNNNKRISIDEIVPSECYICPVCRKPVMVKAINSNSVRTHFAHRKNVRCIDSWKSDMSEWHFEWQSQFPIENREVVVENNGIIHRADVLINNTVIEFQHSVISSDEFEERNNFYKGCGYRVIWLFDVSDKMKIDDCFELVWKRKTSIFSKVKTLPDWIFVQNYLPKMENLLCINKLDSKVVFYQKTVDCIMPKNFLKEFGAIDDEDVDSIKEIFDKTKKIALENKRRESELREKQNRMLANTAFNNMFGKVGRHRRF